MAAQIPVWLYLAGMLMMDLLGVRLFYWHNVLERFPRLIRLVCFYGGSGDMKRHRRKHIRINDSTAFRRRGGMTVDIL